MNQLRDLIGMEVDLERVISSLRRFTRDLNPPVVGSYHVTCSDEVEWGCAETFQRLFVQDMLPQLRPGVQASFRTMNLGARYEWGALRVAEEHYATADTEETFKLLVAKINSHVAVQEVGGRVVHGKLDRYGVESTCCGALVSLLRGAVLPATEELRELFRSGGQDRLAMLTDPQDIPPEHQALSAAIVNARLQADRAVLDIREFRPETPTIFLILPCVTLNRSGVDTELVVGQYGVDWTEEHPTVKYTGLGDNPAHYRIEHVRGRLQVEDDHWSLA